MGRITLTPYGKWCAVPQKNITHHHISKMVHIVPTPYDKWRARSGHHMAKSGNDLDTNGAPPHLGLPHPPPTKYGPGLIEQICLISARDLFVDIGYSKGWFYVGLMLAN